MASRARNKLNIKQVAGLTKVGIYSDGGGLYLRVRPNGRSWFYIGTLNGKRFEVGLGSALDVSLAKARDKAAAARVCALEGHDPHTKIAKSKSNPQPPVTFGTSAMQLVDTVTPAAFQDSANYRLIHPNFDLYKEHIAINMEMNDDATLIKYTKQTGSEKGPYTYDYFNLREREVGTFDQAQGLSVPGDLNKGALEAKELARQFGQ